MKSNPKQKIGFRWTIGDVSLFGFEALRLSIWGIWKIFGKGAEYIVSYNSVEQSDALQRVGSLPDKIKWRRSELSDLPWLFSEHLDSKMAEGVAWKFAPLRLFPESYEISMDNDCIVWSMPSALDEWLSQPREEQICLLAEDVRACFGRFSALCGVRPINSGIRGLPPSFNLEKSFSEVLEKCPGKLESELDEQGLQAASLSLHSAPAVVSVSEVSICSPFPPHLPYVGTKGAHFVGLNAKKLNWSLNGRSADEYTREHWRHLKPEVYARVGIEESS